MLGLYRCVGWYNMSLQFHMFLHVDNSDSPSIVEQSQQGCDSSPYTLLADIPSSVKYPIPYACQLVFCNVGISCCIFLSLVSLCPYIPMFFSSTTPTTALNWGSAAPFIRGVFSLNPGIACLTCQASD